MQAESILVVVIGLTIIVSRGPLLFAPERTLLFYQRLVSTNARVRGLALVLASLAAALLTTTDGTEAVSFCLRALGWLVAASTLWLLVLPGTYRALAQDVIGFAQESTDTAIVRWVGLMAIGLGTWLVSLGI